MSTESREVATGLAKVAHAIRRSTALYCAIVTLPEDATDDAMFARADKMASWLLGNAGRTEAEQQEHFLGAPVNFNG